MPLSHPLFSGPKPSGWPVFGFRAHFFHSAPNGSARFRLHTVMLYILVNSSDRSLINLQVSSRRHFGADLFIDRA